MARKGSRNAEPPHRESRNTDPDQTAIGSTPEATNHDHPTAPGLVNSLPGAGLVSSDADTSAREHGPGRDAPDARALAPGAQRPGTTEGRAAAAARGGGRSGMGLIEAPSTEGQTAFAPATGGDGAPSPGSSGIRATSDPNFTARSADEEGKPSPEALAEQARSIGKDHT